ncbi:sulfotransferase domain-containing protein [Psychroserpens jangbogonensis]|uniref:sulfotransferase domain-containing protein n=1 Tax=Psychroserpens jangbogonensis TaxID=1484460 RepID=UPI00053CF80A|nr:sulfotransferase domain-containing protein [Psychroserpens jangbogonensis]
MSKFNKHIVVVGTARSGTSWLSETIAQQFRYRLLFEPEHETRTEKGSLICDQWIETKAEAVKAHKYLHRVFSNQVDCNWIAQNSNRKFKMHLWPFIPKKYIIKFVRANLSARYINDVFDIPVIHIIRNPYDVIQSQKQVNFPWLFDLSIFSNQKHLVQLIQEKFNYDITQYKNLTDTEKLCLRWCIENVIPLEVFNGYQNKSAVVKYEDLISNIQEFYDLCDTFSIEPIVNLKSHYRTPSSKTHPESGLLTNKKQSTTKITPQDRADVNKLLDIFETQLYKRE